MPQAALSGKETPSAADVKAILSSVGAEADEERLSKLLSELEGKKIDEVVASGLSKLASVPSGGAVAAAAPAAGEHGAWWRCGWAGDAWLTVFDSLYILVVWEVWRQCQGNSRTAVDGGSRWCWD